ncbi:GAF domain-containing protein [Thermoflexus sp.]|uniref:sensor histidine kinase n=1 Tax=Thermoflexus sp. TaxID=1969742 RepID=UPI0035E44BD0
MRQHTQETVMELIQLMDHLDAVNPSIVPEEILRTLLKIVGGTAGWITRLEDEATGSFQVVAAVGLPEALEAEGRAPLRWSPCRCQRMLREGQLTEAMQIIHCERLDALGISKDHLVIPLRFQGRSYGLINLLVPPDFQLDEPTRGALTTIGRLGGVIMGHRWALDRLREEHDRLELLSRIARLANQPLSLEALLSRITQEMVTLLQGDRGAIALMAESGDHLRVVAEYNPVGTPSGLGLIIPIHGNPSMEWILRERRPLAIADVAGDPILGPVGPVLQAMGICSLMIVPLLAGTRLIGTLGIDSVHRPRVFTAVEMRLAETVAAQVAGAVERTRLLEMAQAHAARLHVLYQTARALAHLEDLPALMDRAVQEILAHLPADAASIYYADHQNPETLQLLAYRGFSAIPRLARGADAETITGRVAARGTPLWIEDCTQYPYPPATQALIVQEGFQSHAALPLRYGKEIVGVLNVLWRRRRTFDAETRGLLEALADLLATGIHNARLLERTQRQAQELAALNQALSETLRLREEMIQNVSHELRTPLAVAMGYLELLADGALGPLNPEQQEAVTVSRGRLHELHRYVELMLTLQTVRAGEIARIPLDLKRLLEEILRRWQARMDPTRYTLEAHLPPEEVWLLGDPQGLIRAIGEVMDNAIKFSPGGGKIEVALTKHEGQVMLRIQDEGIGIPEERLDRIGEPFYQVEGGTTRRFPGMGIGLAVARAVVEAHGGKLLVRPRSPRGTEVALILPLAHRK